MRSCSWYSARMSRVPSFEPSSTITSSRVCGERSTAITRATISRIVSRSLYAGMMTDSSMTASVDRHIRREETREDRQFVGENQHAQQDEQHPRHDLNRAIVAAHPRRGEEELVDGNRREQERHAQPGGVDGQQQDAL